MNAEQQIAEALGETFMRWFPIPGEFRLETPETAIQLENDRLERKRESARRAMLRSYHRRRKSK